VRPEELWGRRSVAVGVVLVAIALIGGLILLVAGDGDGDVRGVSQQQVADVSELKSHFLDHTVVNPDQGISVRRPASWKVTKEHGVTNIQSKDRCLVMQLSAPVPAGRAKALRKDGIAVLRDRFQNAKVQSATRSRIGGVPTTSNTVNFTDRKGNDIQVLLSVGTGRKNAYLTQVVVRDPSCQGDLQLVQLMLQSLEYTK
jgi:hypothetical protein